YVKDAAAAYLLLAEHAADEPVRGEAFNFSPGCPLTALAMVKELATQLDRCDLEPAILNIAQGEIPYQVLVSDKARTRLGWAPGFAIQEGLRETVEWY